MTREEAIQVLQTALTSPFIYGEYADAINMAIEALSDHSGEAAEMVKKDLTRLKVNVQDANNVHNLHSGDLISRADVIETVLTYFIPRSHTGERGEHEEDFVRTVFNALPSAEAEWIPCSERLPEVGQDVLFCDGKWTEEGCMMEDGDWCQFRWSTFRHKEDVTAWMPLPKPYREGDEIKGVIDDAPTIDAVEVVRCKDCKRSDWYKALNGEHRCYCMEHGSSGHKDDDYCSYGERKEDGEA